MRSNFEEHRENRINGLKEAAARRAHEADATFETAQKMSSAIPLGQPLLVDHHSYKSDRRYRDRINGKYEKSFALQEKAEKLAGRAEAAADNDAIFSDDSQAVEKLQVKIADLEAKQKHMVATNKAWRKGGIQGLIDFGFSPEEAQQTAEAIEKAYSWCKQPYPSYHLSNNNANLARCKKRLQQLEREETEVTTEHTIGDVRICDSVEDNRVQIFFPGKPSEEVRAKLKRNGFKWAPSVGAWQRHRNPYALHLAKEIAEEE